MDDGPGKCKFGISFVDYFESSSPREKTRKKENVLLLSCSLATHPAKINNLGDTNTALCGAKDHLLFVTFEVQLDLVVVVHKKVQEEHKKTRRREQQHHEAVGIEMAGKRTDTCSADAQTNAQMPMSMLACQRQRQC